MKPTDEEVDCVLAEMEAMLALDHVVRTHNELVRRHKIRLDEEPLFVPFESYEELHCEAIKLREDLNRETSGRVVWQWRCVLLFLAVVLVSLALALR